MNTNTDKQGDSLLLTFHKKPFFKTDRMLFENCGNPWFCQKLIIIGVVDHKKFILRIISTNFTAS